MNKELLLQSIKSVAGYLALITISLTVILYILSNINEELAVGLVVLSVFVGLVWFDYKNRLDRNLLVTKTKIKG
jgi:hypothetical protein